MRKFLILGLTFLFITANITSCGLICGELDEEQEAIFLKAKERFASTIELKTIPCEPVYINAILKTNLKDTSILDSLHNMLYFKEKKLGWQTIMVFDSNEQYLFSHSYINNIYIQTGD